MACATVRLNFAIPWLLLQALVAKLWVMPAVRRRSNAIQPVLARKTARPAGSIVQALKFVQLPLAPLAKLVKQTPTVVAVHVWIITKPVKFADEWLLMFATAETIMAPIAQPTLIVPASAIIVKRN
jgi:hypothetical protein